MSEMRSRRISFFLLAFCLFNKKFLKIIENIKKINKNIKKINKYFRKLTKNNYFLNFYFFIKLHFIFHF